MASGVGARLCLKTPLIRSIVPPTSSSARCIHFIRIPTSIGPSKEVVLRDEAEKKRDIKERAQEWDDKYTVKDVVTHTGKVLESDDFRMARFVDKEEIVVNPRYAIDYISEVAPIACKNRIATCEGGGGPLGHPRVFINLDKPGNHSCGYCGLRFYKEDHHH
ncbi:NADH dehydrogenase (ubiquinone) 13 kDa A subunit [Brevipalpus obovatus]|uniref:NADH dehydrogenase (ubiquinone) 13 kDa A subunit n=1 Tax=Brevipalpus obovatus TaxID=246614 RepID=UPI003D9DBF1E